MIYCDNAATVCNTGAEIKKKEESSVCFDFSDK